MANGGVLGGLHLNPPSRHILASPSHNSINLISSHHFPLQLSSVVENFSGPKLIIPELTEKKLISHLDAINSLQSRGISVSQRVDADSRSVAKIMMILREWIG